MAVPSGLGVEMTDFAIEEGLPYPLGAHWSGQGTTGTNFALFSANATKVEVCLFDGERETHRIELPEYTDEVFHGYISGRRPRHVLRLSRPRPLSSPTHGHRFNPNKLLLDPYARAHAGAADMESGRVRLQDGERRRPDLRRARQRALHAEMRHRRSRFRLAGGGAAAERPLGPDHRLRDPRQGLHQAASRRARDICAAPMPASASKP